ncbi:FAD-dependent oxidoreductase [Haladaptatus sp. DYSN1]|uniref:FAD-dependent oxidoreductase n=1 Tax=unclassified Haladaptatus TaxID=2622732 RepID=UPI00240723C3|nr:FAD-dependent oxidoreductase [Haladaptatus sp. DYSN1]
MAHERSDDADYDVVVVGGGPAGCSVGVFTARYGLTTAIFDRGRSSLGLCGHLENYLGFPAGIDIETFYALMHDHAEEAGCERIPDLVESVTRRDEGRGFVVEPQEGEPVTATRVVAATRYDGEYLRPLGGDAMFETREYDGEQREFFDNDYADADGTTPVEGLYVASPSAAADRQAIITAGRGARVGLAVVEAGRREQGYPAEMAPRYDWVRQESSRPPEWDTRDRWREWAEEKRPEDHELDEERWVALREAEIDRRLATYVTDDERDQLAARGQERLLEHVDDERILAYARNLESAGEQSPAEPAVSKKREQSVEH